MRIGISLLIGLLVISAEAASLPEVLDRVWDRNHGHGGEGPPSSGATPGDHPSKGDQP